MKGKAAEYYGDLSEEIRLHYRRLMDKLGAMYGTNDSSSHLQMKLATLRQAEG